MIGNLYNQNIHYNKEKAISVNHVFSGVSSGGKGLIPKIAHSDSAQKGFLYQHVTIDIPR